MRIFEGMTSSHAGTSRSPASARATTNGVSSTELGRTSMKVQEVLHLGRGSVIELYLVGLLFMAAVLGLGMLISTIAQTQMQAMQMTFFYFLPNILLSGFMFPFQGMPAWADLSCTSIWTVTVGGI